MTFDHSNGDFPENRLGAGGLVRGKVAQNVLVTRLFRGPDIRPLQRPGRVEVESLAAPSLGVVRKDGKPTRKQRGIQPDGVDLNIVGLHPFQHLIVGMFVPSARPSLTTTTTRRRSGDRFARSPAAVRIASCSILDSLCGRSGAGVDRRRDGFPIDDGTSVGKRAPACRRILQFDLLEFRRARFPVRFCRT